MRLRLVPHVHRATHRIGLYLAVLNLDALSQGEAHVLALLAAKSPATVGELHRGLAHRRSTLTSILDRLVSRKLIARTVGAADRRTFVITLTRTGRSAARRIARHLAALERGVDARVSPGDVDACLRVLSAIEDEAASRSPGS